MKTDRRKSKRINSNINAIYKRGRFYSPEYRPAVIKNYGIDGLLMETGEPLIAGEELEIKTDSPDMGVEFTACGKVSRTAEKREGDRLTHLSGIILGDIGPPKLAAAKGVNRLLMGAVILLVALLYMAVMELNQERGSRQNDTAAAPAYKAGSSQMAQASLSGTFRGVREDFPLVFTENRLNKLNSICFEFTPDGAGTDGGVLSSVVWREGDNVEKLMAKKPGEKITVQGYWKDLPFTVVSDLNKELVLITERIY